MQHDKIQNLNRVFSLSENSYSPELMPFDTVLN